jgi:sucrose phosphorylase
MTASERLNHLLMRIYGPERGHRALERLNSLIERFPQHTRRKTDLFTQNDVALITYGDSLFKEGMAPLKVLNDFVRSHLTSAVSLVHYLPFFPWSSDDGFSVKDFHTINPELGTWEDVSAMGTECELMFDFVINHFSSQSQWFKDYLAGRQGFQDMAIEVDPTTDVSMVTRPRSLPLLTPYTKKDGKKAHLWTTFSADQIDFNYESLDVLEKMIEVLLFYVEKGASVLRLDAIAYLWKQIGTPCIHLEQTHAMVQVFRAVLDLTAPDVLLITETNVPHEENISYFGDGHNEAQMVYNFTLPPLLLHAFVSQDARLLSEWAAGLTLDSPATTFFNFTASHDGIGVRPLEGILPPEEIDGLVDFVQACGGFVSTKRNSDGSDSPYELNISYVDAIIGQEASMQAERFLASQAIQYALPGVPATYIHSLLGSRNWAEGVQATGRARSINRQKLHVDEVLSALNQPDSFRSRIFHPFVKMMALRRRQPAFHPNAAFHIIDVSPKVFAIFRRSPAQELVALTNISAESVSMERSCLNLDGEVVDLIGGQRIDTTMVELRPYQTLWLTTSQ